MWKALDIYFTSCLKFVLYFLGPSSENRKVRHECSFKEFLIGYEESIEGKPKQVKGYHDVSLAFFKHRQIAHWQADQFDFCVDGLAEHHIVVLLDFSMNYSHLHLEETSGEHWCHHQTTIVPAVENKKVGTEVQAHSRVFMSNDLKHSNKMVQHVMNTVVAEEKRRDKKLSHVHMWSDGCGEQLKSRWQMWWLTEASNRVGERRAQKVKVIGNYFQSCHGKGKFHSTSTSLCVSNIRLLFPVLGGDIYLTWRPQWLRRCGG